MIDEYNYTGDNPAVNFLMAPFDVSPSICEVTYTCRVISSPIGPVDFCSFEDGQTLAKFDAKTGNFYFQTDDMDGYAPGVYSLEITGSVNSFSDSVFVDLVLVDPCATSQISLSQQLFSDMTYSLRDPQIVISWPDAQALYFLDSPIDCGPVDVEFFNDDATYSALDPVIFSSSTAAAPSFIVNYVEDESLVGQYSILYEVTLRNYPSNTALSLPFTLTIVDPCDEPVVLIAPVMADQYYTITDHALMYAAPVFSSEPAWCQVTYTYAISEAAGDACVSFNPDQFMLGFTFYYDSGLELSGPTETAFQITVTGSSGTAVQLTDSTSFLLTIHNPCIDQKFVSIKPAALLN